MSEYQYYEFLAIDRPLDEQQLTEVSKLSTRAQITSTSFANEYHHGDFRGDPEEMMERYYDAHLHVTSWGTRRLMLRLPRALLTPQTAEQYCLDPDVAVYVSGEHVILDLTSEDEDEDDGGGDWVDEAEEALSALVGVRAELALGDLRPLYLAWLAAYGTWERDEDAFDEEEENELEPPAPAGLGALTAPQRALADFLRLDASLLTVAAQGSPPAPAADDDPSKLPSWIEALPASDKDKLLHRVAEGHGTEVQLELQRQFQLELRHRLQTEPAPAETRPRRTVAELLDAAAEARRER
jgi:hypothetical protein